MENSQSAVKATNEEKLAKMEAELSSQPQAQESQPTSAEEEPASRESRPENEEQTKPDQVETPPEADRKDEDESEDPAVEQPPKEEKKEPSERAQSRWQELANQNRMLAERNKELEGTVDMLMQAGYSRREAEAQVEDQQEQGVSIDQIRQEAGEEARRAAREEIRAEQRSKALMSDARTLVETYPELDSQSEVFEPELDETIQSVYENALRKDPNVSLKQIGERVMKIRRKGLEEAQRTVQTKVQRQAASEAVTSTAPSGRPRQNTLTDELSSAGSIEELEALEGKLGTE